jgi:LuxR family transcriptional regulator, maltose regulon positive regulatory protein
MLQTKFHIPPPRPGAVPRPELWRLLDRGARTKLTLISAPAGFGKSTLLSQWLANRPHQTAWVSLEEPDNAPGRFWAYMCDALAAVVPDAAEAVKAALQAPELPPPEALLLPLLNELTTTGPDLLLIHDDYHLIRTPELHQTIAFLVDHMPPSLHLVLIGRGDPPLPLARWRAREEMVEVRAHDLRFDLAEAAQFLNGARGLGLSEGLIQALHQRTEGWVTGLQLAALSLKERANPAAFVAAFAGNHRYVLDYLVEEVLERQPSSVQQFLLQTSVLDRLSAPLCAEVTGRAESGPVLQALEDADLFLIPLDDDRRWYRYHHLFADVLKAHLQHALPSRVDELHLRAAEWFAREGFLPEAIGHALRAQAWNRAAELVEGAAEAAWAGGEVAQLLAWMKALPADTPRRHPRLCVLYARTLIPTGQVEAIASLVADSEAGLAGQAQETPGLTGEVTAMRAQLARLRGDLPAATSLSRRAMQELLPTAHGWRGLTAISMGGCHRLARELPEALQAYGQGAVDCAAAGNTFLTVTARNLAAEVFEEQGRLHQAIAAFRAAGAHSPRHLPVSGWALVGEGGVLCEWNRLDEAADLLQRGIELGQKGHMINVVVPGLIQLARVRLAQGDLAEAVRLLEQAVADARDSWLPRAIAKVLPWQVRLALASGDLFGAAALLDSPHAPSLARVQLAGGQAEQALQTLSGLAGPLRIAGEGHALLEALVLESLCHDAAGNRQAALAHLQEALVLAEPEAFVRIFLDEGAPLLALLTEAAGIGSAYATRLLAHAQAPATTATGATAPAAAVQTLVEPLSDRELEVLRLVASGATNQEIGQRLFVSVNTVKKHTGNIFSKLGVNNRTQALAVARELGLL